MAETHSERVPKARDLMEEVRFTFAPDMDLMQAIEELARQGVSAAPVVDSQRCLRGILTEKDCLRLLYDSALHRSRGGRVADFMSKIDEALEADMDIFRISEVFLHNNFPMLPVVERGRLVGCITRHHMLRGGSRGERGCPDRGRRPRSGQETSRHRGDAEGLRQLLQEPTRQPCRTQSEVDTRIPKPTRVRRIWRPVGFSSYERHALMEMRPSARDVRRTRIQNGQNDAESCNREVHHRLFSRRLLVTTKMLDRLMAPAASIGLSSVPKSG